MKILAVDDERLSLYALVSAIQEAEPDAQVLPFLSPAEALKSDELTQCDAAFLDIRMSGMLGLELAKRLKEINPGLCIIFVTGYSEYSIDAFSIHATGYVLKPVSAERVRLELDEVRRRPAARKPQSRLCVQTFGNFEVFADDVPLRFERSKSKEIMAYLVDRRGAGCTVRELAAVLFEDRAFDVSVKNQIQTFISALMRTLAAANADGVVIKRFNNIAVDIQQIDCDYYRFLQWDIDAVNQYTGEYMAQYDWAEFRVAYIERNWQDAQQRDGK